MDLTLEVVLGLWACAGCDVNGWHVSPFQRFTNGRDKLDNVGVLHREVLIPVHNFVVIVL